MNIQEIEKHGYKVKALYIGKTYVLKEGKISDEWDKSGLSSRWSTSHSKPARNEIGGRRNMIVLTKAITEDNVPDDIKKNMLRNQRRLHVPQNTTHCN